MAPAVTALSPVTIATRSGEVVVDRDEARHEYGIELLADLPDEEIKRLDQLAAEQGKSRAAILQRIRTNQRRPGPATDAERAAVMAASPVRGLYEAVVDRESAEEILAARRGEALGSPFQNALHGIWAGIGIVVEYEADQAVGGLLLGPGSQDRRDDPDGRRRTCSIRSMSCNPNRPASRASSRSAWARKRGSTVSARKAPWRTKKRPTWSASAQGCCSLSCR